MTEDAVKDWLRYCENQRRKRVVMRWALVLVPLAFALGFKLCWEAL